MVAGERSWHADDDGFALAGTGKIRHGGKATRVTLLAHGLGLGRNVKDVAAAFRKGGCLLRIDVETEHDAPRVGKLQAECQAHIAEAYDADGRGCHGRMGEA